MEKFAFKDLPGDNEQKKKIGNLLGPKTKKKKLYICCIPMNLLNLR